MIKNIISKFFKKYLDYEIDEYSIVKSKRPDLCEYQCNDVFKIAKLTSKIPNKVGEELINKIKQSPEYDFYFKNVEFVMPGFINIKISDSLLTKCLNELNESEKYLIDLPENKKYIFDFGGPNIAKPLHVGHLRNAIIGESIQRILKYFNQTVISDTHLGDYGLQMGQVIYGIINENISIDNLTIQDLDMIYPKYSALCKENSDLKDACAEITKSLQDGDEKYQLLWRKIYQVSVSDIKHIYNYLDVNFDLWLGESDAKPFLEKCTNILEEKNLLFKSEGAMVVDVSEESDKLPIPPLLYKKSNDAYLYPSTDIGTIYDRVTKFNPDYILYETDKRQELHFIQVFRTVEKMGLITRDKLKFIGYGTVNGEDGKPYKTRGGNTPKITDLFDECKKIFLSKKEDNKNMNDQDLDIIVNAIIKYGDLQNNKENDYVYNIDKFSETVGKTGPGVLYSYLRINKILKDCNYKGSSLSCNYYNNYDHNLRLRLIDVQEILYQSFENLSPSIIADYVYDICNLVNVFYQNNHIVNLKNEQNKNDWLFVLDLSCKIIQDLLNLLAIKIPSKM